MFKHKEKILKLSALSDDDVVSLFEILLRRVNVFKEELISPVHRDLAAELCRHIDPQDSAFVALTLEVDGLLWTGDKILKEGLHRKGFQRFFDHSQA